MDMQFFFFFFFFFFFTEMSKILYVLYMFSYYIRYICIYLYIYNKQKFRHFCQKKIVQIDCCRLVEISRCLVIIIQKHFQCVPDKMHFLISSNLSTLLMNISILNVYVKIHG